jgi:hypothetical protein
MPSLSSSLAFYTLKLAIEKIGRCNKHCLDAWVQKLNLEANFTFEHLSQFIDLWVLLQSETLNDYVEDSIHWKLTTNGQYSAASAYELQFFGLVHSSVNTTIWKTWAPLKVKHHAWLVYQGRL